MKWIKLTDKEPKFGITYLVLDYEGNWQKGDLLKIELTSPNVDGKKYIFGSQLKWEDDSPQILENITHYMKIELPK